MKAKCPNNLREFELYLGCDTSGARLKQTWNWLEYHDYYYMPSEVDNHALMGDLIMVDSQQSICKLGVRTGDILTGDILTKGWEFYMPDGMLSDGMSIPWWSRSIAAPKGKGFFAGLHHDLLTNDHENDLPCIHKVDVTQVPKAMIPAKFSWVWKAELFYYSLRYCGFSHFRAMTMYNAVRLNGWWKGYA